MGAINVSIHENMKVADLCGQNDVPTTIFSVETPVAHPESISDSEIWIQTEGIFNWEGKSLAERSLPGIPIEIGVLVNTHSTRGKRSKLAFISPKLHAQWLLG